MTHSMADIREAMRVTHNKLYPDRLFNADGTMLLRDGGTEIFIIPPFWAEPLNHFVCWLGIPSPWYGPFVHRHSRVIWRTKAGVWTLRKPAKRRRKSSPNALLDGTEQGEA